MLPVYLPPLRDREGDTALLAQHFLDKAVREEGKAPKTLSPATLAALDKYAFPGNVRELENIINRAVLLSNGDVIEPRDLPIGLLEAVRTADERRAERLEREREERPEKNGGEPRAVAPEERGLAMMDELSGLMNQIRAAQQEPRMGLAQVLEVLFGTLGALPTAESVEAALIERALKLADGNVAEAAKALGMSRATIYRRIRKEGGKDDVAVP